MTSSRQNDDVAESPVYAFVEEVKSKIPIESLYTELTGEAFVLKQSRLKARNVWRDDSSPSMQLVPGKNLLWDFAEAGAGRGQSYDHIALVLKAGLAKTRGDAVRILAKRAGLAIPEGLDSHVGKESDRSDFLNYIWQACQKFRSDAFDKPEDFSSIRKFCETRQIPFHPTFFETMDIGIWPTPEVVLLGKERFLKKSHADVRAEYPELARRGIVFPLHNSRGHLVGLRVRNVTEKLFKTCQIAKGGMYGLRDAMAQSEVQIYEGEMNPVQFAAQIFREHGEDRFAKRIPHFFCTGSVANSLSHLRGNFEKVFYFPDVKERKRKQDQDTADVVLDIYNALQAPVFLTTDWGKRDDKYDVDDFIRDHAHEDPFGLLRKMRVSMPEFLQAHIERKTEQLEANTYILNAARLSYCEQYAARLHSQADATALRTIYNHIQDSGEFDVEAKENFDDEHDVDLGDGFAVSNGQYCEKRVNDQGVSFLSPISDFVIRPTKTVHLQKPQTTESAKGVSSESHIHARIICKNGDAPEVVFVPTDLIDAKAFWSRLLSVDVQILSKCNLEFQKDIFLCAVRRLVPRREVVHRSVPGPYTRHSQDRVLMPDKFNRNLNTFLCREFSVIDGKVCQNRDIGVDVNCKPEFGFAVCDDEELKRLAYIIWNRLRKLQKTQLIDVMLGFTFNAPIKHLLVDQVQALMLLVVGQTNSFKTSLARLCRSFYGPIYTDNRLNTFHGTLASIETMVSAAGSAVDVIDEFKPSLTFNEMALNEMFHHMYSGKSKGRLNQQSEMREQALFNANIILTAERVFQMEASVEARHFQVRFEPYKNADESKVIYNEINQPDILGRFNAFTPRLIAWQHRHIDEMRQLFAERDSEYRKILHEFHNNTRISMQRALIDVGFWSFAMFCAEQEACSIAEANEAFQNLCLDSRKDIVPQAQRSAEMQGYLRFIDGLKELINTNTVNVAYVSGEGSKANVTYSKSNPNDVYIVKYTRKGENFTAIISFNAIINVMNRVYNTQAFTKSLIVDLQEAGYCKLDSKRQIALVEVPDISQHGGRQLKRMRAIVIADSKLEEV